MSNTNPNTTATNCGCVTCAGDTCTCACGNAPAPRRPGCACGATGPGGADCSCATYPAIERRARRTVAVGATRPDGLGQTAPCKMCRMSSSFRRSYILFVCLAVA